MPVPGYQDFIYPFLEQLQDSEEHHLQDLYAQLAEYFHLTEEEIAEKLPSGKQTVLKNRIGWENLLK